jgi:hypothetical protein
MTLGEYAGSLVARQAMNLIGSGQPVCPETAQWAAVAITATIRLAECRGEDAGELRAALKKLERLRNGKTGPKLVCMCEYCVKHRARQMVWYRENIEKRRKHNREYMRRKKTEKAVSPGGVSDEELDRRAEESLRAQGFR